MAPYPITLDSATLHQLFLDGSEKHEIIPRNTFKPDSSGAGKRAICSRTL